MSERTWRWYARSANWWIRRNPTYLLSAAAMASGARWYLVVPDAPAGEIGRILLTLGVLQGYELAVSSVLIALHRNRKSPEDQPSLLLIAALFWTGPMAATVEMAARDATSGMGFAAVACVLALAELQTVRRTIGLCLSSWCQLAASACVLLVAVVPNRLRLPHAAAGTDEVALYLSWWILGAIMLLTLGGLTRGSNSHRASIGRVRRRKDVHVELAFLGMVFAATAVHLWGMNYAFFGNARPFYAAPVLTAVAIILFEYFMRMAWQVPWLVILVALLPVAPIAWALKGFAPNVPPADIPLLLRDPVLAVLVCATGAWWFGCIRLRMPLLLHGGALALVVAVFRAVSLATPWTNGVEVLRALAPESREETAVLLYGLTAYLIAIAWLRRSRIEILVALAAQWTGFAILVWGRMATDLPCICFLAGWTWLAATHVAIRRPSWRITIWPVAALAVSTGVFASRPDAAFFAAVHAAGMVALLLGIGWLWPWSRYRTMGVAVGGVFVAAAVTHSVSSGEHPRAAVAVLAAFLLLAAGTVLSWHKRRLLELTDAPK